MTANNHAQSTGCGRAQFRADVRLVHAPDRKRSGLQRGLRVVWLPDDVADFIWERGPDVLGSAFHAFLKEADMLAEDEHLSEASDRNAVFLSALCAGPRDLAGFQDTDFVIVGCGGLGSQIAVQLAALGAHNFFLVDGDRIDESNLNRLTWATRQDVGQLKTDRLASYLSSRFSATVLTLPEFATGSEAVRLIMAYARNPFLVLAGDNASLARQFLTAYHAFSAAFPPYLHVGYVGAHCIAGPLVARPDDACPFCNSAAEVANDSGFVAPSALANNALIAGFAVSQIAMERLTRRSILCGHRWLFDLRTGRAGLRSISKHPECKVCHP